MQVVADWQRSKAWLTADDFCCIRQLAFPHIGVQPQDLPPGMELYLRPYCNTARDGSMYLIQPHLRSIMQVSTQLLSAWSSLSPCKCVQHSAHLQSICRLMLVVVIAIDNILQDMQDHLRLLHLVRYFFSHGVNFITLRQASLGRRRLSSIRSCLSNHSCSVALLAHMWPRPASIQLSSIVCDLLSVFAARHL